MKFQIRLLRAAAGLCLGLISLSASAAEPWIFDTEYNEFRVVVSPRATVADFKAAALFQERWERHTGFRPEVGPEPVLGMVNVWIGFADNPFVDAGDENRVVSGGYRIETLDHSWRKRLRDHYGVRKTLHVQERYAMVIAGGGEDGPIAGVNAFFDTYMMAGQPVEAGELLPSPPAELPRIKVRYTPPATHFAQDPSEATSANEPSLREETAEMAMAEAEAAGSE